MLSENQCILDTSHVILVVDCIDIPDGLVPSSDHAISGIVREIQLGVI